MSSLEQLRVALADRYTIERELGAGGMATVYLAEDLKHKRKVAIKVLKPELAAVLGAERFVQEITTTAALQHPHILPLFDSGTAYGPDKSGPYLYYVMPFIDGETLRAKLDRETQLGIDESVRIASDVASALHYAHEHGVIHRDIKPENILLHDGRPMVADFGIALAVSAAAGGRMTETGLSLGTPHYMSPEQATAEKEITARSDVYSLGSVLYEMLTGNPPHTGASAQQIIMKIVTTDAAPVTELRKSVPPNVAAAVAKSLQKLPADRFASAAEFSTALGNSGFTIPRLAGGIGHGLAGLQGRRPAWQLAVGVAAAVLLGAVGAMVLQPTPTATTGPTVQFAQGMNIDHVANGTVLVFTPDAGDLIFIGPGARTGGQLYRRAMAGSSPVPIAGTAGSLVMMPFPSPDGSMIGYYGDQQLRVVPTAGGTAHSLALMVPTSGGGSWGPDNQIVYSERFGAGLKVISADGGESRPLTRPDTAAGVVDHRWPHFLPGGKSLLLTIWRGETPSASIGIASMATGEVRELIAGTDARYVQGGFLVFATNEGTLQAVRFDPAKGQILGSPVTVLDSVLVNADGAAGFALSANGTLAHLRSLGVRVPAVVERGGQVTDLPLPIGEYQAPRYSPDGRSLAISLGNDIWIYDFELGTFGPLTSGGGFYPLWTPDGRDILFSRVVGADVSVFRASVYREREPIVVLKADAQQRTQDLSPDGRHLLLRRNQVSAVRLPEGQGTRRGMAGGQYDLWSLALEEGGEPTPWLSSEFLERAPTFSPDGRWVAYSSDESGRDEIYVRPFPGPGGRTQISTEGGTEPAWSRDGRELLYRSGTRLEGITVVTAPTFRVLTRARTVLEGRYHAYPWQRMYDISPDGRRFIMLRFVSEETTVTMVVNWIETVRRRFENP